MLAIYRGFELGSTEKQFQFMVRAGLEPATSGFKSRGRPNHSTTLPPDTTDYYTTYLVINGVKLGEQNAVNQARVFSHGEISQSLVKLLQLIHRLVPHQGLPDKQNQVRRIELDQLKNKPNADIKNKAFIVTISLFILLLRAKRTKRIQLLYRRSQTSWRK